MANDKNIKKFTAADIEKYHKGMLSPKEMHALEKAALDDPFLADALEGYAVSDVNANADLAELQNRLKKRLDEETRVAPIAIGKTSPFPLWKIAAMIVLIAGAGLIVYQFGFNKKAHDIAQATPKEMATEKIKDSIKPGIPINTPTATNEQKETHTQPEDTINNRPTTLIKKTTAVKNELPEPLTYDPVPVENVSTATDSAANLVAQKYKEEKVDNASRQKRASAAKQFELRTRRSDDQVFADSIKEKELAGNITGIAAANSRQRTVSFKRTNTFHGRVTDAYNNALPFSNITNTEDGIGTYSDARGYFTLTSPDSVLNVQVSSVGFETNKVDLKNNVPNNNVLLKEDRSSLAEIVISNKKPNSNRSRDTNMVLDEPEPADGWNNYDLYLVNNLKVPEVFKEKKSNISGEVELSFDVDKNGEPINITVKKSLCESCDKEAIRLIKEGPKWKSKIKKGKATVKVSF